MAYCAADKEHPLRYACDRCHAHKLRCNRVHQGQDGSHGTGKACSRCLRARKPCVIGLRGKVGRPAKNTKRKNEGFDAAGPTPYDDSLPQQEDQSYPTDRSCIVAVPAGPNTGLPPSPPSPPSALAGALSSHAGTDERVDAHMYAGLPSPSPYLAGDLPPFPFSPGEMESWEAFGLLPYDFKAPLSPTFGFGPSAPHDGGACSQEPSLATSVSTLGGAGDGLESVVETVTVRSQECIGAVGTESRTMESGSGRNSNIACSFVSAVPDAQKLPTPASSSSPACPPGIHERLCDLSLRISTAFSSLAEHGAFAGDAALKDVSGLASELIDAARQIVPQLPQASSTDPPSESKIPAEYRGHLVTLAGPTASSPVASEPRYPSSGQAPQPTLAYVPDAGRVFLLLACYAGLLSALERVLEGLGAQQADHQADRGAPSLSWLERSLAANAVHYLLSLLREALCLQRPGSGGSVALPDGGGAVETSDAGPASPPGLFTATWADIQKREDDIQRRAERLQQAIVR